jgi:rhamnogalacturonyl hydrolase YesR
MKHPYHHFQEINSQKAIHPYIKGLVAIAFIFIIPASVFAQTLPTKTEIVNKLKLVNDYWISQNASPGNNQWARAVYFTGNMDFYKIYPKDAYVQYATLWANNSGWGLNTGNSTRNADNQICGQTYIDLYNLDAVKVPSKINAIKTSVDYMVSGTKADDWSWVDALNMAMPVFARLGVMYNDTAYFQRMYELYTNTKVARGLFNTSVGLWYRDENYKPPYKTLNGEDSYWSRGNGWAIAAEVRVLQLLPQNYSHRAEFVENIQLMAAALKDRQRPDGFWNPSLNDANEYNGPETSGTALFTYGIAWGINNNILDSATYYPVVVKAWNGLATTAVQSTGFLGYVQPVGAGPAYAAATSTQDFGVGAFLLAGTEVQKLATGVLPVPTNFSMKSVKVVDKTHIRVAFSKKIDTSTSLATANYSINNGITVSVVNKGDNDSTTILTINQLSNAAYQLQINNIKSADGSPVENGETKTFVYTGIAAVTASGFEPGTSNTADKTLDYDFASRWSCDGKGQWILYDLGEIKQISSVDIAFFNGNSRKGIFSMYLSTNLTDSVQVFNGMSSGRSAALENYDFTDQPARYIKIIGGGNTQSTWNSITETRINWTNLASGIHSVRQNKLKIYPNPMQGNDLNISLATAASDNHQLVISDMCGKTVYSQTLKPASETLKVSNLKLAAGAYTVLLGSESGLLLVK